MATMKPNPKVTPMHDTSRFWAWFDSLSASAILTDDGKQFAAAGFRLDHTGGGCTGWRRDIEGTDKFTLITNGDLGHTLSSEDVDYFGMTWLCGVHELENGGYSQRCETSASVARILAYADRMEASVMAGDMDAIGWIPE